jgi:Flp pilus assembly protein TadD
MSASPSGLEGARRLIREQAACGNLFAATTIASRSTALFPDQSALYEDLGVCLSHAGQQSLAVACFERSGSLSMSWPPSLLLNLAVALMKSGRADRATATLMAVDLDSILSARMQRELAVAFQRLSRIDRALECFDRSDILSPDDGLARYFSSLLCLSFGHFDKGWRLHERRWRSVQFVDPRRQIGALATSRPRFSPGRDLTARVLVWGEQGVGDEVMFGSMLGEFRGWCGKMLVQMDKRLIPLFRRSLPQDVEFYERGSVVSEGLYDSHIPIGSLGLHLRPSRESFEGHRGAYLKADPDRVRALRESFGLVEGERLIGVSWRSSNPETGAGRSLPLWELAQVLGGEGRRLVNLQYGSVQEEIAEAQARCGIRVEQVPDLDCQNDLDGLAALIMACDEVVSIGNATAHLAGALGQKTTVLLPYSPSWRWTTVGTQTPWYQSLLLLRQHASDEWAGVLDEAQRQLVATG